MKKLLPVLMVVLLGWFLLRDPKQEVTEPMPEPRPTNDAGPTPRQTEPATPPKMAETLPAANSSKPTMAAAQAVESSKSEATAEPVNNEIKFELDDGVAILTDDIVLGVPQTPMKGKFGKTDAPQIKLWEGGLIPYYIQPSVAYPDRVMQAIALFQGTGINFVPFSDEADALVFEAGEKNCRSYLGKVGGRQPVWISSGCGVAEVAHEIMHALGFIHEQNRIDRDQFININWDNIDEAFAFNFQVLPPPLMQVSGTRPFDYRSIMMYAPNTFAKNASQPTMTSKTSQQIDPLLTLSETDIQRIREAYQ